MGDRDKAEQQECLSLADAILCDLSPADAATLTRLLPSVYDELRRRAAGLLRGERLGHALQATALVHEAYLRLAGQENLSSKTGRTFSASPRA